MSKYVPIPDFTALQRGTIVRGKITGRVYVVDANYGDRVTVVTTSDITHLSDWEMFEMSSSPETGVRYCPHCGKSEPHEHQGRPYPSPANGSAT